MPSIKLDLSSFKWEKVYSWTGKKYSKTMITKEMKDNYGKGAVYRWNIYGKNGRKTEEVYIGQSKKLCPDRLRNYLRASDDTQKTNVRVNRLLNRIVKKGMKADLEVLNFSFHMQDGNKGFRQFRYMEDSLQHETFRCLLENLLICYYEEKGIKVLNKIVKKKSIE